MARRIVRLTDNQAVMPSKKRGGFMKKLLLAIFICFTTYGFAIAAVNINTATKEELTTLQGIGEKRAQDIIDFRTKNGPFKSVDDLQKVPGIGPGTMKQIRSQLSVTGKTTIDKPAAAPAKASDSTKTAKAADTKKEAAAKGDAMKAEKKAADTKQAKTAETKKTEPAKGDATRADAAKEKTAAKPKADEKAKSTAKEEKKAEKK
jgi:competence protein ComEA